MNKAEVYIFSFLGVTNEGIKIIYGLKIGDGNLRYNFKTKSDIGACDSCNVSFCRTMGNKLSFFKFLFWEYFEILFMVILRNIVIKIWLTYYCFVKLQLWIFT